MTDPTPEPTFTDVQFDDMAKAALSAYGGQLNRGVLASMLRFAARRARQTATNTTKETDMPDQVPTIGRIVHYHLSLDDCVQINRRRTSGANIGTRMKTFVKSEQDDESVIYGWPEGAQAHIGAGVKEGDTFPMLIVKTWGDKPESAVNGQVFLDGNDVFWATSVCLGDGPRSFSWPTRA